MKKIIYILILGIALAASSCADFTELQPKGKNLLETADQLNLLLNNNFESQSMDFWNQTGDIMYSYSNIGTTLKNPVKTRRVLQWTWDEQNMDLMADLTSSDSDYSGAYSYIGQVCNPILMNIEKATGEKAFKDQLAAEAYTLRAYLHYIVVNKFAKAYNPATAESTPAIAYLKEDSDITKMQEQLTLKEVYENIVADCDAAIALNALPVDAINRLRVNKACPYAVKALALMSMQNFDEAEAAAKQALAINGVVLDYRTVLGTMTGYILGNTYDVIEKTSPLGTCEDYFMTPDYTYYASVSPEAQAMFENGHMMMTKYGTMDMMYDYMQGTEEMLGLKDYITLYSFNNYNNSYGLNTPQMHLIVAEVEISKGNYDTAMESLDKIRAGRIDPYTPLKGTVSTKDDAIKHLKQTSHGEGFVTIYNFITRKRWTQLDDYKETYYHTIDYVDGTNVVKNRFELKPDSPMWVFPFPKNVIAVNPNIQQNYK